MAGDEPLVLHKDTGAAATGQSGAPGAREEISRMEAWLYIINVPD